MSRRKRHAAVVPASPPRERRLPLLIGIFAAASGVRLLHLALARHAPFFELRLGDGLVYDAWARQIASGDLVGRGVFYQAPLYPYFLGLVYAAAGDSIFFVRALQEALSALACVLVADAAWRLFSRRAAIAAGLMLAFYPPSIFLDGLLQKSALDTLLVSVVVWLTVRIVDEPRPAVAALLGVAAGALALTRENAIVLILPIAAWLLLRRDVGWSARRRLVAILAAGALVVLAPVGLRNLVVGGQFELTTSQFGPNFYIGNNANADGGYHSLVPWQGSAEMEQRDATMLAEKAAGRTLTPSEVSGYYTREALRFIADEPARWLALVGHKLRLAISAGEIADTEDQYTWAEWSWPLKLGVVWNFGLLLPLGIAGAWLSRREWRRAVPLWAMAVVYLATVVLFYVFARYRFPLVPVLAVFAGRAVADARKAWQELPTRELAACGTIVVALAVFCFLPAGPDRERQQAVTHYNVATGLIAREDTDGAIGECRAALALDPALTMARYQLGVMLASRGDLGGATAELTETIRQLPHYAPAHNNLGVVLGRQGRNTDAEREFRAAVSDDPQYVQARVNLGQMLLFNRRSDEAADEFRRALAIDPSSAAARAALAGVR